MKTRSASKIGRRDCRRISGRDERGEGRSEGMQTDLEARAARGRRGAGQRGGVVTAKRIDCVLLSRHERASRFRFCGAALDKIESRKGGRPALGRGRCAGGTARIIRGARRGESRRRGGGGGAKARLRARRGAKIKLTSGVVTWEGCKGPAVRRYPRKKSGRESRRRAASSNRHLPGRGGPTKFANPSGTYKQQQKRSGLT